MNGAQLGIWEMKPMHFTRSVSMSWDVWVSLSLSSSQLTWRWTHRTVDQSLGSFQLPIFTPAAFPVKERRVASRGHLEWWRESVREGQESMQGPLLTRAPLAAVLTTGKLFHILSQYLSFSTETRCLSYRVEAISCQVTRTIYQIQQFIKSMHQGLFS